MMRRMSTDKPFRARIACEPDFPLRTSHIAPLMTRFDYLHCHPEYEIAFIPKDCGSYLIQDQELPFAPGDVFIVNANDVHQPIIPARENQGAMVTYFRGSLYRDPEECAQWLEPFLHASEFGFNKLPPDEELRDLLLRLHETVGGRGAHWKLSARGLMTHILSITARLFAEHCEKARITRRVAKVHRFAAVIAHINENLAHSIQARQLYRLAGLSHSRFSEEFRAAFGVSVVRYIHTQRLKRAKRLLRSTAMTVTEVAFATGFGASSQFNTVFKKEVGSSPSEFRRSALESTHGQ
jgi:AraC-like DNA-binding protein